MAEHLIGLMPKRACDSQVSFQHGAQYALPAAAQHALPAVEAKLIQAQRTHATFLLVGTPLALLEGNDDDDDDADGDALLDVRPMLPGAA